MPPGAMVGGVVKDGVAAAAAMRQLLARTEISDQRAFVAVNDALATFRILHLPRNASSEDVEVMVAREMPIDPERLVTRWVDLAMENESRVVYAAAWDRTNLRTVTDAVRSIGIEPVVVELKSASIARAVVEPAAVVVDLSSEPAEIVLIDRYLPQVWHNATLAHGDDLGSTLSPAIRSVMRFYRRRRDVDFPRSSPVLLSGEQVFTDDQLRQLGQDLGQPVMPLPAPPRVPGHIRHTTYLACLGLIMRRTA